MPKSKEIFKSNLLGVNIRISRGTFRAGTKLQHLLVKLNAFKTDGKCFLTVSFYWYCRSSEHQSQHPFAHKP